MQDEIHTYATRSRRTILETLADFRSTRIPMSHILEVLPPLRRRQFSIASSAKVRLFRRLGTLPNQTTLTVRTRTCITGTSRRNTASRRLGRVQDKLKDQAQGSAFKLVARSAGRLSDPYEIDCAYTGPTPTQRQYPCHLGWTGDRCCTDESFCRGEDPSRRRKK